MIDLNASSRIMYETAQAMGISCTIFGDKETILMEKDGKSWYVRGSRTSLQSSVGKTIADSKPLTKKILTHFGLPTAKGVVIKKAEDLALLSQLQYPLALKPLDGRHGDGVKVGLKNQIEVEAELAKGGFPVLAEEMLSGVEYRIVCVDFKFLAAAFRKPAHVVGDGSQTVEELIIKKNQHPWRGEGHQNNLSLIKVDEEVLKVLAEQALTLTSVPPSNHEVLLRKTANLSTGGEAWDVTETVSAENRQLFEKIAKACDLNVIGIDIMCQSLERDILDQPQAGVIEVNASPGLRMHHFPMKGEVQDIATKILTLFT